MRRFGLLHKSLSNLFKYNLIQIE